MDPAATRTVMVRRSSLGTLWYRSTTMRVGDTDRVARSAILGSQ
jgi:hypothetical protein